MAWLELHQTLPTNRKTMRLKKILKIKTPQAVGHLCMLWLWALDNAPDGDLSAFDADEIAEVAGYAGKDAEKFAEALKQAGFLDVAEDGKLCLHDWNDYAGKLAEQRERRREANRARVQKHRDRNATVTRYTTITNADVMPLPNTTLPNSTVPEERKKDLNNNIQEERKKERKKEAAERSEDAEETEGIPDAGFPAERAKSADEVFSVATMYQPVPGVPDEELPMVLEYKREGWEVTDFVIQRARASYRRFLAQAAKSRGDGT